MSIWAILSMGAFITLLTLNVCIHIWAPPYAPLRRALKLSALAYLLFSFGDFATYLTSSQAGYTAAVMVLYSGAILVTVSWWLMCLRYAESIGMPFPWATQTAINIPLAIGALLWVALLTNPWHGQFVTPIRGARNEYLWLWWVNTGFAYGSGSISAGLYLYLLTKAETATLRTRLSFMVSAPAGVMLANAAYALIPLDLPFDPTPIAFAICATLYLAGIYRVGYLSLSRLAIRTILDQQPNGLVVNDTTGTPLYWNQAAEDFLGQNLGQIHEHTRDWLNQQLSPLDPALPLVALQPGKEAALFSPNQHPTRTLSIRLNTLESWRGDPRGCSYLIEDVTKAQQRQDERDRLHERIAQAQKLDGLGVLAGGVAHDFNNLLMGIRGNTELALQDIANGEDASPRLKTIEEASKRATKLTHHLLTYAGQAPGEFKSVDLSQLIKGTRLLLQTTVRHDHCELELDLQNDLLVHGDEVQLEQIVMNLAINATEAAPVKSTVLLSAGKALVSATEFASYQHGSKTSPGAYVWLEARNSGERIEPAVMDKMFDPFFSTKSEGRGLGLAAVLGIVRKHNGALRVQSWAGANSGTSIRVLIPCATNSVSSASTKKLEAKPEPDISATKVRPAPPKNDYILVVDDDRLVRDVACRFLQSAGYSVLEADSGAKALAVLAEMQDRIKFVVLDVVMPDMNGPETWKAILALQPTLPVLFISGHPRGHLDNLLDGEPVNYLEKPFSRESFLGEIASRFPAKAVAPSPAIEDHS